MSVVFGDAADERHASVCTISNANKQQQFSRLAELVPIPEDAFASWTGSTQYPVASFMLFHASAFLFLFTTGLLFVVGSREYPSTRIRRLCAVAGAALIAMLVGLYALSVQYGPGFLRRQPYCKPVIIVFALLPMPFIVQHSRQAIEFVPFQNRFAFLCCLAAFLVLRNMMAILTVLEAERGPPDTHPLRIILRSVLRAVRMADAMSDLMVVRTLLEKVSTSLKGAVHVQCAGHARVETELCPSRLKTICWHRCMSQSVCSCKPSAAQATAFVRRCQCRDVWPLE